MKPYHILFYLFVFFTLFTSCLEEQEVPQSTPTTLSNETLTDHQDDETLSEASDKEDLENYEQDDPQDEHEQHTDHVVDTEQEPYQENFCFDTYIKVDTQQACTKSIPPICRDFTTFSLMLEDVEHVDIKQLLDRGFKVKWAINGKEMQGEITTTTAVLAQGILATVSYNDYINSEDLKEDHKHDSTVVDICAYVQFRDCNELMEHCIIHHFDKDDTELEDSDQVKDQEDEQKDEKEYEDEDHQDYIEDKECFKVYIRSQQEQACTASIPPSCQTFTTFSLMLEDIEHIDTAKLSEEGFKVKWAINGKEVEGITTTADFILAQGILGTVSYHHNNSKEDTFDIKQIDVCAYVQFRHCGELLEECMVYEF